MKLTIGRVSFLVTITLLSAATLSAATFTTGDVFASLPGKVTEFTPTGASVQTLTSGLSGFETGSAFDSSGNLYVTNFSNSVIKFADNAANTQTVFKSGFSSPEDVLVDSSGNVFVTDLGGSGLQEFNSAGVLEGTAKDVGARIDWFDLNSSESIMYYTDESGTIHVWNLATNTALPNLCSNCGDFALRLLGDGTLLVAANGVVNRVNTTSGAIVQTYNTASSGLAGSGLFALNLDPDGTTFWTGSFSNDDLYRVNIATGALVKSFNTGTGGSNLYGVSVFGERTQTGGGGTVPEPSSILLLGSVLLGVGFGMRKKLQNKA
jgi:sugar lactone lactonase YvrE